MPHERSSDRGTPETADGSTNAAIPVAPSLVATDESQTDRSNIPGASRSVDHRTLLLSLIAMAVAVTAACIARLLTALIGIVTNLAYYGRLSTRFVSPAYHHLGLFAVIVPAIGGLLVGFMAKFGSRAIRGHGIPEAMEQILANQSRIPPRITFLKPLSAAIAIGTGGPFGAEGPIIATGGALGSFVGQLLKTTAVERKILLAAGAAAGMTATFGSPVSAVILAVELLLFEFRARSLIPVALASATAAGVRYATMGSTVVFPMPVIQPASQSALLFYLLLGAATGLIAVWVTRLVYAIEDGFERLPISWVWWPAIGGLAVGVVGVFSPHTLGVGYDNIEHLVGGTLLGKAALLLCILKLISWSIALGSGTSGGTLAPLFTIGGGIGATLGGLGASLLPHSGIDVRVAALVGMAALFAGASRAFLTSVVFAFETTQQPLSLLPLLTGCTSAYLLSCLLMKNTIMTEKIVRRGIRVPSDYAADYLEQVLVSRVASHPVTTLAADAPREQIMAWIAAGTGEAQHQGYPVVDEQDRLLGVITRRDLLASNQPEGRHIRDLIRRPAVVIYPDNTLREAADRMVRAGVGRLPVVERAHPDRVVGILTRGDLLSAHTGRLNETHQATRHIRLRAAMQAAVTRGAGERAE